MQEACKVHANPASAVNRLAQMGLTMEALDEAVRTGLTQASGCTENDVPMARGLTAWMKTVRGLRDQLCPLGWQKDDSANFSTVVDPTGSYAIAVAAGDAFTGLKNKTPSTVTDRGPMTGTAVAVNRQLHLGEISEDFRKLAGPPPRETLQTWYLVYYEDADDDEIRLELSLPNAVTGTNRIVSWMERIIIAPQLGAGAVAIPALGGDVSDDLDIPVRRREVS